MGVDGQPGPTDSWVTLAGLARETSRIRLGTLVSSATFRHPALLAVSVAQVDQMSGGRVELGLGTGWFEAEHRAFGLPFGTVGERFDRFEEQLQILQGLWTQRRAVRLRRRALPAERQPGADPARCSRPLPIIIGGGGAKQTPRLAATYAHEFNRGFSSVADTAAAFDRVRAACETTGRELVLLGGAPDLRRAATTPRSPAGPRRSAATSTTCARTASPAPRPRSSSGSASSPRSARRGSTCRCSTWPTWTTSTWSPARSRRSSEPGSASRCDASHLVVAALDPLGCLGMKIAVPAETRPGERRVAAVPDTVAPLVAGRPRGRGAVRRGCPVAVGRRRRTARWARRWSRVTCWPTRTSCCTCARCCPTQIARLRPGAVTVGFLAPSAEPDGVRALRDAGVTAFSVELVPRISRAQSMDALTSQALVAGYRARARGGRCGCRGSSRCS